MTLADESHFIESLRSPRALDAYRTPRIARSVVEIVITALPLVALWISSWLAYRFGYWWASLLIGIPASGFLVRLFMIQHDCGHGAFFRYRSTNDWVGRAISILTLTPYDFWRQTHAVHHATSGDLDRRGLGDIDTLTLREFQSGSRWTRFVYRLYRHPMVMFGIGPAYLFFLQHRLPVGLMRGGWRPWVSTMATNGAIACVVAVLMWLIGIGPFLLVHLPIMLLASTAGVWLFFVQHQFEETRWQAHDSWAFHEAALAGSSYYDLPAVLQWFAANIGIHHVHHLQSRIPFYRLPHVLRDHPELTRIGRVTLRRSLSCVRLALWDEGQQRLISFRQAAPARQRLSEPFDTVAFDR